MEIGMETIDNRVTKGTFGEGERLPARLGIESGMSGEVRDGSVRDRLLGMMSVRFGMGRNGSGLGRRGSECFGL